MSELVVRKARPDEFGAVGDLVLAAYVESGLIDPGSDYVRQLRDTATRAAGAEVTVAVDAGGALLGTVTWCPPGSAWREIARTDEGEFRMLAVADEARGRGVGEALVRACVDRSRADGLAGTAISTMSTMVDAQRLYRRLGFVRAPEQDWSPVDGVSLEAMRLRFCAVR